MILITGGTGLVGSHLLLQILNSEEKVCALYRESSDLSAVKKVFGYYRKEKEAASLFKKIIWRNADITDIPSLETAFSGITHVYHCAALISFDPSKYKQLRKINIEGTANVVNCCIAHKVQKLCYVSSIATLDEKLDETSFTEKSSWNQEKDHDNYAITKYGAEIEVWRAGQEGVPTVIVNPGIIIGPGFWNSGSGLLFKKVHSGLKFYIPKTTGFVGVQDVVKTMVLLMKSSVENEQFILVSENCSFKTVLKEVAVAIQKPAPTRPLRPWMVFLGWGWQKMVSAISGKERKIIRQLVKSLFTEHYYSNEKIKAQLHVDFTPIDRVVMETGEIFRQEFKK